MRARSIAAASSAACAAASAALGMLCGGRGEEGVAAALAKMGGQGDEGGEKTSFTKKELDEKLKQVDDELKMTEAVRLPARLQARLLSLPLSPASGSR